MKLFNLKLFLLLVLLNSVECPVFSQTPIPDIFSPTFSHLSGRYSNDIQVQLATRTANSNIYFTLDGSTPDSTSQLYTGNILISGDGSIKTLKTITKKKDSLSRVSSATYIIDYSFNSSAPYLTNLSFSDYSTFMIGDWFGYANTPWTNNYNVKLSILPNGNYIDTTTSSSQTFPFNDVFDPVFYYGISNATPNKIITPYNLLASGFANGFVDIDFGMGSTNQDELRYIKFIDQNNMYLEMWHHSIYGPLRYYLTKINGQMTTDLQEKEKENIVVFPNPATDFIVIKNLNSEVTFINQMNQKFVFEKNEIISVSKLPKGLYMVIFKNSSSKRVYQKVVIE